ncbi:MAG: serine/threonine-protein kinase, partial [Planctomycetaceae bacterium]
MSGTGDSQSPQASEGTEIPAESIGEFRLLRRLGQGGMAEVYLAEQTSLKRPVALKLLRRERLESAGAVERFETEALAAAALNHPNIVSVYLVGEHAGRKFLVQEYVSGGNLRERVQKQGALDAEQGLRLLEQAASALSAAHKQGIVHRDIKPENLLLTEQGDVKVADFGLAQLTLAGVRNNLTQEGLTLGTPLYMSPEQVSDSKLDQRSDLYSLGVTFYHVLAGQPPYSGKTALAVAMQHADPKQKPQPLAELRPDLPLVVCRIVHKLMAKDVTRRYQTAEDLLADLKRLRERGAAPMGRDTAQLEAEREEQPPPQLTWKQWLWQTPDTGWAGFGSWMVLTAVLIGGAGAGLGWTCASTSTRTRRRTRGSPASCRRGRAPRRGWRGGWPTRRCARGSWRRCRRSWPCDSGTTPHGSSWRGAASTARWRGRRWP